MIESLDKKLASLPKEPGTYMMKNQKGEIIYVGKAKNLFNRVRSYFTGVQSKDLKTQRLVREIIDVDIILTKTEPEALLLERTLIKHHSPKYNVMLKDGKEYPFIRVHFQDDWPRIEKVRRRKEDGALYYGPFSNAGNLKTSLKLMGKVFPLIRCSRYEFKAAKRPCNYYHMNMCLGPCTLPIERDEYVGMIKDAISFLMGKNKDLIRNLKKKMNAASDEERYEQAAQFRDQLLALEEINKRQSAVVKNVGDADVFGIARVNDQTSVHVLMVREGRIVGGENFIVPSPIQTSDEILGAFILQYYENRIVPIELIFPHPVTDIDNLLPILGPADMPRSNAIKIEIPSRGERQDLIEMSEKNAAYHLQEATRHSKQASISLSLIKELLHLDVVPERIECFDISNLQGEAVVASNVCFMAGKPAKHLYRHYTIKDLTPGQQDDFGSITEVIKRRLARAEVEEDLPDLIVIDGGRGQLNAALKAAKEFPDLRIPMVSLAKSRIDKAHPDIAGKPRRSYERVFLPKEENPIALKPGSAPFRLLTHIRDEAHRFAISHHRKTRSKNFKGSTLEEIPGVGPALRKRLLEAFGSLEGIAQASLDQLTGIKGISENLAVVIHTKMSNEGQTPKNQG